MGWEVLVWLNDKQTEILRTELRCVNAKNDPCWGYSDQKNRIISACINDKCPKIKECNPNYSPMVRRYWESIKNEIKIYRNPSRQPEYYFVDMIPDSEMKMYISDPENDGREYSTNPIIDDNNKNAGKSRIDPVTGRKQVIIGVRWQITDNSDYQNESLVDIWGYVDDVAEQSAITPTKARPITKIESQKKEAKAVTHPKKKASEYQEGKAIKEHVLGLVSNEIKLTDIATYFDESSHWLLVLSNPAEEAYVSSMLLKNNLHHGFEQKDQIELALIEDLDSVSADVIFVSSNVLKAGCLKENVEGWKKLAEEFSLIKLTVSDRGFYDFGYGDGQHRWTCRNMYGVTHVCVESEDIISVHASDGLYDVSLVEDKNSYQILTKDAMPLGKLGTSFVEVIMELKIAGEIENSPAVIEGVSLEINGGKATVLGMGHLKFIEY